MEHLAIPALVFAAIELVAYAQGLTAFTTLAGTGMWLCCGMQLGWYAWERTQESKQIRRTQDGGLGEEGRNGFHSRTKGE